MNEILFGDCRASLVELAGRGVKAQTCVTSPPYFGLRDYGHAGQLGLEQTPEQYIAAMVEVFRAVRDVLADDGTLWVNIGDSYANGGRKTRDSDEKLAQRGMGTRPADPVGVKQKDLIGIPWMLAFALRADGWYLRQEIIWAKPNAMPESVTDRCTKSHETIFLLAKSARYFYDNDAVKEPAICGANGSEFHTGKTGIHQLGRAQKVRVSKKRGEFSGKTESMEGRNAFRAIVNMRNKRSVWTVATRPYKGAHFATFPSGLIEPCILAGSRPGDIVLDPFMGSGTTAAVAVAHGRQYLGCELNPEYKPLQDERIAAARSSLVAPAKVRKLSAKAFTYRQLDIFEEAA